MSLLCYPCCSLAPACTLFPGGVYLPPLEATETLKYKISAFIKMYKLEPHPHPPALHSESVPDFKNTSVLQRRWVYNNNTQISYPPEAHVSSQLPAKWMAICKSYLTAPSSRICYVSLSQTGLDWLTSKAGACS